MNKKTLGIIGVSLLAVGGIGTYLVLNSNSNIDNINTKGESYNYNYTFSGMIKDRKEINFSGNIDASLYFEDNGLKERVKINRLKAQAEREDEKISINWTGLDIIQDEYKKYIKLGNLIAYDDGEKKPFEEEKLKTNIYYYFDDEGFKEIYQEFGNNDLVKILFQSMLTSNPDYYLKKHNFFPRIKKAIFSQKLAEMIFVKQGDKYVISDVICKFNNREYAIQSCKKDLEKINKEVNITWENEKNKSTINLTSKEGLEINIVYENKFLSNLEINFNGIANIAIDKKGIQKINIDTNSLGDNNQKLIV